MKTRLVSHQNNSTGNIVFYYLPVKYREVTAISFIPFYISIVIAILELIIQRSFDTGLKAMIVATVISIALWVEIRGKRNDKIEEIIIRELLQNQIKEDVKQLKGNPYVVAMKYERLTEKSSKTVGKRYFNVALSDGRNMTYYIINPVTYGDKLKLEINTEYSIV